MAMLRLDVLLYNGGRTSDQRSTPNVRSNHSALSRNMAETQTEGRITVVSSDPLMFWATAPGTWQLRVKECGMDGGGKDEYQ